MRDCTEEQHGMGIPVGEFLESSCPVFSLIEHVKWAQRKFWPLSSKQGCPPDSNEHLLPPMTCVIEAVFFKNRKSKVTLNVVF